MHVGFLLLHHGLFFFYFFFCFSEVGNFVGAEFTPKRVQNIRSGMLLGIACLFVGVGVLMQKEREREFWLGFTNRYISATSLAAISGGYRDRFFWTAGSVKN